MKLKDQLAKIMGGIKPAFSHSKELRPNLKGFAFMLLLFIILGIIIFVYDQSYCVNCETGKCECETQSFIGFGLWIDLAAAAIASYLLITVLFIILKKHRWLF